MADGLVNLVVNFNQVQKRPDLKVSLHKTENFFIHKKHEMKYGDNAGKTEVNKLCNLEE